MVIQLIESLFPDLGVKMKTFNGHTQLFIILIIASLYLDLNIKY